MKKNFTLSLLIIFIGISSIFAQVPQKISYQGVLTDIDGNALNGDYSIQFSLWNQETAGNMLWVEEQQVTVNYGNFDVYLGVVSPIILPFDTQYWLQIQVNNLTPLPRVILVSSPYSFISNNVIDNAITSDKIANGTIQGIDLNQMGAISGNVLTWNGTNWVPLAPTGETDPIFTNSVAFSITTNNITNWNSAFNWGNHATAGYLTSYSESDPVYSSSPSSGITSTNVTNWNSAFSWGNHATAGYLTSYSENDPVFTNSYANSITGIDITNWNTAFSQGTEAYSWGNHANAGYLTTYEEYDPLFSSSWANSITGDDIYNWNQAFYFGSEAYSWGNHLNAGYLHTYDNYVQSLNSFTGEINIVAGTNITVQESENNIIISSTGGGSGITFPYLGYPNCNTDAFTVMNSGTGGCVVGLASNNNVGRLGSQTYGAVGVNGTNGNLGGLGNLLFSVVGINGTTNTVDRKSVV